jgi:indole-3-glycerol phosphate synthase
MILDEIVASKRAAHERRAPIDEDVLLLALTAPPLRDFRAALRGPSLRVIAEFKRRSPSAGDIRPDGDARRIACEYAIAGAAALSVLTDEKYFGARDGDLQLSRAAELPVLRKDFLLDRRDVMEARMLGADAALLIVRLLEPKQLRRLIGIANMMRMTPLVEAHSEREIELALEAGADVIGVNHRDLDTLAIDLSLSARARALVGKERILVAESGLSTRDDFQRMRAHGVDAVLVGEALMRAPSPGAALAELLR